MESVVVNGELIYLNFSAKVVHQKGFDKKHFIKVSCF